jgi:hypothetical protein
MATSDQDEDADREKTDEAGEDEAPAPAEPAEVSQTGEAGEPPVPAPPTGSGGAVARGGGVARGDLGKSVLLFFIIVGGMASGYAILGREEQMQPAKPRWSAGQIVDVEITLVKNDKVDLACSAPDEIAGRHCAFEANNKAWSKGDNSDDKKLFKPYTTTEHLQFVAAGLWSEPALAPDKIPATRFTVRCKYKVEGTLKSVGVRWEQTGQFFTNSDWFAGSVSGCSVL